jgi:acetylserotonin N-methyltransferase
MTNTETVPDPAVVLDLLEAFRRSKTMFAAVSLGVFDALESEPRTLDDLAAALRASADGLKRLLDACVGLQLLSYADGHYANTPAAATYLTTSSPRRLTGYIGYSNDVMWKLWANLEDAVREGSHRWQQTYGWDGPIFSHFFRTEEAKREFLMGMHGFGVISSPHVVAAFDLSRFKRLADLGAATGHLVIAACERYQNLRGVVFDLPEALPLAREIVSASTVASRIEFAGGDFFTDPLPAADLYSLGRILHDWSEAKCIALLKRIYDALPAGGALLIAEKLLQENAAGPRWAQMQNLNMLTCTEGQERTAAGYDELLREVGFHDVQTRTTTAPLDAVLAVK